MRNEDNQADVIESSKSTPLTPRPAPLRDPIIWAIVISALLLRIGYNLALHADGHPLSSFVIDEREYFGAAHVLAEGRGFTFFDTALWIRPPLYVLFLALPLGIFGSADTTPIMLVQSVLSACTLLPLAWLGDRLGGRKAARLTASLGAVYLPFTLFAGLLLSETLFLFLFSLALVALWLCTCRGKSWQTQHPATEVAGYTEQSPPSGTAQSTEFNSPRRGTLPERSPRLQSLGVGFASDFGTKQPTFWLPVLAGGLLGLCVLTRATALAFVPLAALWLFFSTSRRVNARTRLAAIGVLLMLCGLVLLPWVVRNYRAYGQFVAVDTTSGYNLWLGSVGVRDEERLQADLCTLSNPVSRQQFAYEHAFENIEADPAAFVRKGLKESLDLWRPLFSAEERQVSGYTLGRVPGWHLLALLVFDDLLYMAVVLLALLGLLLSPGHPLRSLTLLWVLLWVIMSFVFFAVTRFRLPVVASLIPWAGAGIAAITPIRGLPAKIMGIAPVGRLTAIALAVASIALVLPAIAIPETLLGAERWAQQEPYREAEQLVRAGKLTEAIQQYKAANLNVADTRYGLASALLRTGDTQAALNSLLSLEPPERFEPFIIRGEAARRANDLNSARSYFNERVVKVAADRAVQWAWDHLEPPVTNALVIGSGLDLGYINGFYGPETDQNGQTYRWSTPNAQVRNVVATSALSNTLQWTWSGWRPEASTQAKVNLGRTARTGEKVSIPLSRDVANTQAWTSEQVPDTSLAGGVDLRVNPFVPGGSDPRLLGIRIAKIAPPPSR